MAELDTAVHETVSAVNRNQWNNLVEQSDHGTVFHRYGWLRAVERGLGLEGRHAVVTKNGNPVAIMPTLRDSIELGQLDPRLEEALKRLPLHRLVSAEPGYGGPLVLADTGDCLELLFDAVEEATDGWSTVYHTVKVPSSQYLRYSKFLAKRGHSPTLLTCRIVVDLTDGLDRVEREMDSSRRRGVRRGRESGIQVEVRPIDETPLEALYLDYRQNMQRIDGTVFPRSFFVVLAEEFAGRTVVTTARLDGDVVGRYLHLLDEEQSSLRYFFAAIGDDDYFADNISELLHVRAMEWAVEEGYDTYDFGATGADYADGQFRYKEKYGGDVVPVIQWQRGRSAVAWPVYRLGRRLYQKMSY